MDFGGFADKDKVERRVLVDHVKLAKEHRDEPSRKKRIKIWKRTGVRWCLRFTRTNPHMAMHLIDNLRDYGPFHVYWCFAMERWNGDLGNTKSNNHPPEFTIMRALLNRNFTITSLFTKFRSMREPSNTELTRLIQSMQDLLSLLITTNDSNDRVIIHGLHHRLY